MYSRFASALTRRIADDLTRLQAGNFDELRFGFPKLPWINRLKIQTVEGIDHAFSWLGYVRSNEFHRREAQARLLEIEPLMESLEWLFGRLADESSRRTLVEVVAYWVLGGRHTRLARNNEAYARALQALQSSVVARAKVAPVDLLDGWLDDYVLNPAGFDIKLRAHKLSILNTYLLQQYCFNEPGAPEIGVREGDVVIDGGGCWGDTALYFAHRAGPQGMVHAFEFSPSNLTVMRENLARNPALAARIRVHEHALWNVSGETISCGDAGPSTTISTSGSGGLRASTCRIDDWALSTGVDRVDFIKLDVEGAENRVLEGAARVIARDKPVLAVALYHSLSDFAALPRLIYSLEPRYRFHLGHYTIHREETVFFASFAGKRA